MHIDGQFSACMHHDQKGGYKLRWVMHQLPETALPSTLFLAISNKW
jgi:hypothetical protein